MNDVVTKRLVITGRVQGVGYRMTMCREAHAAGISGWVRNCRDGSVEAIVQGPAAAVERVIAWAHQGPARGKVADVTVEEASGAYEGFTTLATA